MFFEICARRRPELLDLSKRNIFFFEMIADNEVEAWSDTISREAIARMRQEKGDESPEPSQPVVPPNAEHDLPSPGGIRRPHGSVRSVKLGSPPEIPTDMPK